MRYKLSSLAVTVYEWLSEEKIPVTEVVRDLDWWNKVIAHDPRIRVLLSYPRWTAAEKEALGLKIQAVWGGRAESWRVLQLLWAQGKDSAVAGFLRDLRRVLAEQKKMAAITVETAVAITTEQQERLVAAAKELWGLAQVKLNMDECPELLGGFVLRYNDEKFDTSVRRKLQICEQQLHQ